MSLCTIMMGIPGSGKTSYVLENFPSAVRISNDLEQGEHPAIRYKSALRAFIRAVGVGVDHIVVDNCNLVPLAAAPFRAIADAFEYDVEFLVLVEAVGVCAKRRKELYSRHALFQMSEKLDRSLSDWPSGWPKPRFA